MADGSQTPPDLHDQVIVVTGGNSGIGKEAAVALATMGATVVITARNAEKGVDALEEIRRRSGRSTVEVMALDLADFASIRSFAADLLAGHDRLDVLVNNAGGILSDRLATVQGFEMTFGVNHLGHFLLTDLLLDRLRASTPARVINVSSAGHRFAYSGLDFADLQSERRYWSMDAYGKSKLANILFTRELAKRLVGTGVTANCLHPGVVRTGFGSADDTSGIEHLTVALGSPFYVSAERGARTTVYLASSPEVADRTGGYYVRCREHRPSRAARDPEAARRLWEISEQLVASAPV
jgi:NAD(P)-dependent dehydrogenase (short-subunit alcohol dehydrogenase family)